jgi:hypothetical protein
MFQAESNKSNNLLRFVFSGHVTPEETTQWRENLVGLLKDLRPGFKLLSDFGALDSMDVACAPDIETAMDLCDKAGIAKVVRIITDPRKDIGFSIMSLFHYRRRIPIVTCETMEEALKALGD